MWIVLPHCLVVPPQFHCLLSGVSHLLVHSDVYFSIQNVKNTLPIIYEICLEYLRAFHYIFPCYLENSFQVTILSVCHLYLLYIIFSKSDQELKRWDDLFMYLVYYVVLKVGYLHVAYYTHQGIHVCPLQLVMFKTMYWCRYAMMNCLCNDNNTSCVTIFEGGLLAAKFRYWSYY